MSKLAWDNTGERLFESGVSKGVLYPQDTDGSYPKGVAWNGLTGVSESPSGGEATALYADNIKYLNLLSTEEYGATISAYTYPDEFAECDGSASLGAGVTIGQQKRRQFGFSYRTELGNDTDGTDYGYKLHIVYGALAAPSDRDYSSINDSPDAIEMSWEISTTPVTVTGYEPTASLEIDSKKVDSEAIQTIEDILYGTDDEDPRLPLPDEILELVKSDDDDDGDGDDGDTGDTGNDGDGGGNTGGGYNP